MLNYLLERRAGILPALVLEEVILIWRSQCQGRKGQVASDKGREKRRMNYETHETHEKNSQKILVSMLSKFRVFGVFRG